MEGDSRNPRVSLLRKYDIPIDHLSYEYIETCKDKKELERIVRILRSGEEGSYPDLVKTAENQLRLVYPDSRVLRVETPVLTKESLLNEEWNLLEKELLSWEEEIKVMDKGLEFEKHRFDTIGNKNLPEIRKAIEKKPEKKGKQDEMKKVKIETNTKNERIRSGDYAAWEKFDVDKELLKLDLEEERNQEKNDKLRRDMEKSRKKAEEKKIEPINIDTESYSNMEMQVLANQAKDRGNECFKSGDYETALKYYNVSLKLCPSANAYNNRAMTYIKLKSFNDALSDCNEVLKLEKNNVKALHRRATAYQNIPGEKNNELALQDLIKIVSLEPTNRVAQADLQSLKKKLNIQDIGKRFRMMIEENDGSGLKEGLKDGLKDFWSRPSSLDKRSYWNSCDDAMAVHKLPLTYYGPSTSTFQCEPQSMTHRMLSGPTFSGEVMCKCNSNATRQNPLCYRCGERMSRPKPKSKLTAKSSNAPTELKTEVNSRNEGIKSKEAEKEKPKNQTDTGAEVESHRNHDNRTSNREVEVDNKIGATNEKNPEVVTQDSDGRQEEKNENSIFNGMADQGTTEVVEEEIDRNRVLFEELDMSIKERKNLNNEQCKDSAGQGDDGINRKCNESDKSGVKSDNQCLPSTSSQVESRPETKKSKSKKKKSKESRQEGIRLRYSEPVKILQAPKYLKPTSSEPKPEPDATKEVPKETISKCQFKNFVPSKKSTESGVLKSSTTSSLIRNAREYRSGYGSPNAEKIARHSSLEGNKENIIENGNIKNSLPEDADSAALVESSFQFMKCWESMKKTDESYEKRAEIMRSIRPEDLKIVIGNNLDSDMLKSLLECLEKHFLENDPKKVTSFLKELPQIPRFGIVNLFLDRNERKVIERLIECTEKKGFALDDEVKNSLKISF